jgi:hypothetical protein
MPDAINAVPLDNIAHVIQVALTPVFLLSGRLGQMRLLWC